MQDTKWYVIYQDEDGESGGISYIHGVTYEDVLSRFNDAFPDATILNYGLLSRLAADVATYQAMPIAEMRKELAQLIADNNAE